MGINSRILFALASFLIACSAVGLAPAPLDAAFRVSIKVGVYHLPPLSFKTDNDEIRGVFPDVLEAIAREENWSIRYVYGEWAQLLGMLDKGEIDVLAGIAETPARDEHIAFTSQSLLTDWGQIYVPTASKVATLPDLSGSRIGAMKGDIYREGFANLLRQFDIPHTLLDAGDYTDLLEMAYQGQADAVVLSRVFGAIHAGVYNLRPTPIIFTPVELRFGLPRPVNRYLLQALDHGLERLREQPDSVYYQSLSTWLHQTPETDPLLPAWLLPLVAALVAAILLSLAASFSLRRLVASRTGELALRNKSLLKEISERIRAEERLRSSLREKDVLIQEIHHRVKNNLQVIIALITLQSDRTEDRHCREALGECQSRVMAMALVHETLYRSNDMSAIDMPGYLESLAGHVLSTHRDGVEVKLVMNAADIRLDIDKAVTCGLLLNELMSNALLHGFAGRSRGEIVVAFDTLEQAHCLEIKDDGVGLPPDLDPQTVDTLGISLVRILTGQLGGRLEYVRESSGTHATISFP